VDARYQYYEELLPSVERAQELIRTLPSQRLFDRDYLEHELIPALGLNNEQLHEQPQALAPHFGKGLHLWQYPNQLSGYLVWMARHASQVSSYMEIGCRWGGTFILTCEWLRRVGADLRVAVAVDPIPETPFLAHYRTTVADMPVLYRQEFSTDPTFIDFCHQLRPDFVLVDGDHSMKGVMHDHVLVRNFADIIVHHDIVSTSCPDTTLFWRYLANAEDRFTAWAFTDQYDSVGRPYLGLGVLKRKGA
jgi:cephalosporin hydroxylase